MIYYFIVVSICLLRWHADGLFDLKGKIKNKHIYNLEFTRQKSYE